MEVTHPPRCSLSCVYLNGLMALLTGSPRTPITAGPNRPAQVTPAVTQPGVTHAWHGWSWQQSTSLWVFHPRGQDCKQFWFHEYMFKRLKVSRTGFPHRNSHLKSGCCNNSASPGSTCCFTSGWGRNVHKPFLKQSLSCENQPQIYD